MARLGSTDLDVHPLCVLASVELELELSAADLARLAGAGEARIA